MPSSPTTSLTPQQRAALLLWTAVGLLLVLFMGRLAEFWEIYLGSPLNGDIYDYVDGARAMRHPYDTGYRGPVHALCLKAAMALVDGEERALRMTTVVQSMFAAPMVFLAARTVLGSVGGLLVLALFTVSPVVALYGVGGLRDPMFTALLAACAWLLLGNRRGGAGRAALAGVAGALLYLTHVSGLFLVVQLAVIHLWRRRAWRPGNRRDVLVELAALGAGMVPLIAPDLYLRDSTYWNSNIVYWRNVERLGAGGAITTDPNVSMFRWMFHEHTLSEVVTRLLGNHVLYVTRHLNTYLAELHALLPLFWVGLVASLARLRWEVPGMWVMALSPMLWVLNLSHAPGYVGVENRLVYHVFPFALLVVVYGLGTMVDVVLSAVARRDPRGTAWQSWWRRHALGDEPAPPGIAAPELPR